MPQQTDQQHSNGLSRQEFLQDLLDSDVSHPQMQSAISDLLAGDYPLANITSADREYFRLLSENVSIYAREQLPDPQSWAAGALGAALYDQPEYYQHPMNESERVRVETALMDHFARSSRGVGGWQQDKLTESIQTQRVEDNRGENDDSGGFLGL